MKKTNEVVFDINTAYCKSTETRSAMELYKRIENL